MRVITGQFKGRQLQAPEGNAVRPTSDRVKESLFNILQTEIEGSRFLDLCAGAGGVGIEAMSREASHVTFVERDAEALACLKKNLPKKSSEDRGLPPYTVYPRDFRSFTSPQPFDFIFVDFPYADLKASFLNWVTRSSLLKKNGLLIVEHAKGFRWPELEGWTLARQERYGRTILSFFKLSGEELKV